MRWPAVAALALALVALVAADRLATEPDEPSAAVGPMVASAYSGAGDGDTWFCAGGAGGSAGGLQEIMLLNTTAQPARAGISLYPAVPVGGRSSSWPVIRSEVDVAPYSRLTVDITRTVTTSVPDMAAIPEVFVAAQVVLDVPGVVVFQTVSAGGVADVTPCRTATSDTWHFATASTRRDARVRLSLLNPYSDDAVVDIAFATDDGRREPVSYKGVVVPANALRVLDVGSEVTRRAQLSFSVVARSGNVVAARLQTFDGGLGVAGLAVDPGAHRAATQWLFPLGVAGADTGAVNSFVLYNPGTSEARVDLAAELDAALLSRGVPPFELTVPAGRRVEVVFGDPESGGVAAHPTSVTYRLDAGSRLLPSEQYWVSVRSFNGVDLVVERLRTATENSAVPGVAIAAGRTAAATRGLLVLPDLDGHPGTLALVNPSLETISRLSLEVLTSSGWYYVSGMEALEIRPRQRLLLPLDGLLPADPLALRFDAAEPLVASYAGPAGLHPIGAIPQLNTLADLETTLF